MTEKKHKAGFVNILGNPNVGKSTLMNALVGEKLSIITQKVQTTRHRIMGIINQEDFQIVYSDTPGIINDPGYLMQERMMKFVDNAIQDADVFLFMIEAKEKPYDSKVIDRINKSNTPVILIINKIDLSKQEDIEILIEKWQEKMPNAKVIPASALHNFNVERIFQEVLAVLPESPPFFDKEQFSDKPMRFFVSEIIREKIILHYQQEIPYSVEVEVESYKEEEKIVNISAIIYVARDSQKGIIIGKGGSALKRVGTEARLDIEKFIDKKVFLQLYVKVNKNWREKENVLKRFGYFDI